MSPGANVITLYAAIIYKFWYKARVFDTKPAFFVGKNTAK